MLWRMMINETAIFVAADTHAEAIALLKGELARYVDGDRWLPEIAEIATIKEGWAVDETRSEIVWVEDWLKEMGIKYRVIKV